MKKSAVLCALVFSLLAPAARSLSEEAAEPPPRSIPGISADDAFPNGCVDCHVVYQDINLDTRISVIIERCRQSVEPTLLARAQAAAPTGLVLKGRHPAVANVGRDIPASCLECHAQDSTSAPPLARMLHLIHLTGGATNHFMTLFQGECTHCHKLEPASGRWTMPTGPEP